jgi:hypothetical protein
MNFLINHVASEGCEIVNEDGEVVGWTIDTLSMGRDHQTGIRNVYGGKMRKLRSFSIKEQNTICQEYIAGLSSIKLGKKWNCHDGTINYILIENGIPRRDRSHQRRKYDIDEYFFDEIDTPEKAYFLGFLYADGGFVRDAIYLMIQQCDESILFVFNTLLKTNKPVRHYTNNQREYSKLEIANKRIVGKLQDYGIVARKTHKIRFPQWMPENLVRHFIRGYFDGDGGLNINRKTHKALVSFSSNEEFCKELHQVLKEKTKIGGTAFKVKDKNIYRLAICGNNQILRLLDWMYDQSTIHLPRKIEKYYQLQTIQKSK